MTMFCGSCGARSASPDQRFCAACGQPLATAAPAAPQAPVGDWSHPVAAAEGTAPSSGGPRFGRGTLLVVAGVVAALVAGSVAAWALLRPSGGSDSPEAAVRDFLAAAQEQDVVGMLDHVNPGEVKGFVTAYDAARERAVGEDLTAADADLAAAFDVELTEVELETHQDAESIAQVTLEGGRYDMTYDPAKVPGRLSAVAQEHPDTLQWEGDLVALGDNGYAAAADVWPLWWVPEDPFADDADYEQLNRDLRPSIDTVRVDGRWYVSLVRVAAVYTGYYFGSNYAPGVGELDWEAADGEGEAIVGETPEDVVAHLVDAVNSLDAGELLDSFPPDEVIALRPLARAAEAAVREEAGRFDVSVDDLDLSTEDRGDTVVVTLERGRAAGSTEDDYAEVEYSGGCFYGTFGDQCLADEPGFEPVRDLFVVMEKVDGGYQLSWSATAAEYALLYAETMPDRLVDEMVEELENAAGVY